MQLINTGYLDAVIFLIVFTIAIYVFAFLIKKIDTLLLIAIEIILGSLMIFLYLIFIENKTIGSLFTVPLRITWLWLTAAGYLSFLGGNYFSLLNLKEGNAGTNSLLSPFITIISSQLAVVFLDEKITKLAFIGIAITSLSVLYYLSKPLTNKSINIKSLLSGTTCVIFISTNIICTIKGVANSNISLFHAIFLKLIAILPIALTIFLMRGRKKMYQIESISTVSLIVLAILLQTILANYFWLSASLKIGTITFQLIVALLPFCVGLVDAFILRKKQLNKTFYLSSLFAIIGIAIFFLL